MPRFQAALAALCLTLAGCSQAGEATANQTAPAAPAAVATPTPVVEAGSRILGKRDFTLRGKPACEIRFVYAGHEAEELFWEEPCDVVTAELMTQADLDALAHWDRLDDFAKKFVTALPKGQVLYVEGSFSASVYPIGTTGTTYEVPVAD